MTKKIDPIPEDFESAEEAGEFWDTHATTDYPDALEPVEVLVSRRHRYYEVEIEMSVAQKLQAKARERGVSVSDLATELLREKLAA